MMSLGNLLILGSKGQGQRGSLHSCEWGLFQEKYLYGNI